MASDKPVAHIAIEESRCKGCGRCIAACPKALPDGRFAAQVSIASGAGSASTDRVMRFVDDFPTFDAAARYAVAQGIDWVKDTLRQRGRPYSAAVLSPADPICI